MNDDQITAISREYAEEINPVNQLNGYPEAKMIADMMRNALSEVIDEKIKDFEGFVRFLLRRYCLVEKRKVKDAYMSARKDIKDGYKSKTGGMIAMGGAKEALLESLFPEIAKEVEG